jgi:hypothetical protein
LVNENQKAGSYKILWNGKTNTGFDTASGIYYYRMTINGFSKTLKMVKIN